MRKTAIVVVAIAVVGVVLVCVDRGNRGVTTPTAATQSSSLARSVEPVARAARPAAGAAVAPMAARPASLRGTDVDGELVLGADGRFLPTASAIRTFDYFLTTLGEVDLAGVRLLVAEQARRQVPGRQDEVLALFDRYVAYLGDTEAAARRAAPPENVLIAGDPVAVAREQLGRVEDLQRTRFGADVAARLFGDDNALARAVLDRSDVLARDDLSPEQRDAELAAIEARLPPAIRDARARMRAPVEARQEIEALRRRGASDEEIHAVRARWFGEEAADRLDELDRRSAP